MKKSDRLYDLIKSLTKNEKGYFKKFSNTYSTAKGDNNQYILLFDAIDRQKEYDEASLIRKFSKGNDRFNFSSAKKFLYDRILKSLELYHAGNIHAEIRSYLNQTQILIAKVLLADADKLLEKAEQLATKHEIDELMPDILLKRLALWKIGKYTGITEAQIIQTIEKLEKYMLAIRHLAGVYQVQGRYTFDYTNKGVLADAASLQAFGSFIEQYEQHPAAGSDSFPVRLAYLLLLHSMYMFGGRKEKAHETNLKLLELYDTNMHQLESRRNSYQHILARVVESYTALRRFDQSKLYLDRLKQMVAESQDISGADLWEGYLLLLEIMLLRRMRDFKALKVLADEKSAIKYFERFENRNYEINIEIFIAHAYFYSGDYDRGLDVLNSILNNPRNNVRGDFYCYSKLLMLLIQWELGNHNLLPYEAKSTRNYFDTKLSMLEADRLVIRFVEKHMDTDINARKLVPAFERLRADLDASFKQAPLSNRLADYIDIRAWIESKVRRVPITDLNRVEL
jgi:hypothetical protein